MKKQPTEFAIIKALKESGSAHVSGELLARKSSISRAAIWKHISNLRKKGYDIEAVPRLGYRLVSHPDLLLAEEIMPVLKTKVLGKKIVYKYSIGSTNTLAKELASKCEKEGTVVIAEEQSHGKGRLDRKWVSPAGGIWLSVILRPLMVPSEASRFTLLAAVSVARAVEELGLKPQIKWPNDVLIDGKKICGILLELSAQPERVDYLVIGFGINANIDINQLPVDSRSGATSLSAVLGRKINRRTFVANLLLGLEEDYARLMKGDWMGILAEWTKRCGMLNKAVSLSTLQGVVEGQFIGVDDFGAMRLELPSGEVKTFAAGDVTVKKRLT